METIIETILEFVEPDCEITAESSLRADCGLSSFDSICLLDALCTKFNKEVNETVIRECHTVQDLANLFLD